MFPLLMDLPMGLISLLLGLYFFRSNGKAASLLFGYNTKSVKEREKFDEKEMCRCYGKKMIIMGIVFLFAVVIDLIQPGLGCTLAWCIWTVLFILLLRDRARREK